MRRQRPPAGASRRRPGEVSLERALSKLGLASRTQARKLIVDGEVTVDGKVARDPGRAVRPERVKIRIKGQAAAPSGWRAILLHKPRGVVTTRSDERGRPTVYSLLAGADAPHGAGVTQHLATVGRLDLATTGLLILTNDTQLANWLTDPANAVPRVYVATVRGEVDEATCARLVAGVVDQGERLSAARAELLKASGRESVVELELVEGKNREIRRLCEALGHEVTRLKRVSFGGLVLGDLAAGKWRDLARDEIARAFPGAPLRGGVAGAGFRE